MDQLIAQITQRTGISDEQARQAVQVVAEFAKQNLPPQMAAQVDSFLGAQGGQGLADQASQLLGGLGGMLGKQ